MQMLNGQYGASCIEPSLVLIEISAILQMFHQVTARGVLKGKTYVRRILRWQEKETLLTFR